MRCVVLGLVFVMLCCVMVAGLCPVPAHGLSNVSLEPILTDWKFVEMPSLPVVELPPGVVENPVTKRWEVLTPPKVELPSPPQATYQMRI